MQHRSVFIVVGALVAQTAAKNYHYGRDLYGESSDNHTCQLCEFLFFFYFIFLFFDFSKGEKTCCMVDKN